VQLFLQSELTIIGTTIFVSVEWWVVEKMASNSYLQYDVLTIGVFVASGWGVSLNDPLPCSESSKGLGLPMLLYVVLSAILWCLHTQPALIFDFERRAFSFPPLLRLTPHKQKWKFPFISQLNDFSGLVHLKQTRLHSGKFAVVNALSWFFLAIWKQNVNCHPTWKHTKKPI